MDEVVRDTPNNCMLDSCNKQQALAKLKSTSQMHQRKGVIIKLIHLHTILQKDNNKHE
jgi:hypothetical protein